MKILVIDDEVDIGDLISAVAQGMSFECIATTSAADFKAAIDPSVTLIIIDLMMPDTDGIELLRILGKQRCKSNIILMSGVDKRVLETAENLARSFGLSVVGTLQKPFRVKDLEKILMTSATMNISSGSPAYINTPTVHNRLSPITKEELQLGIDREEFVLYYQPQIEMTTNRLVGLEALVRWQHPQRGLTLPDDFISLSESCGLIDQLGWLIVKRSLNEIKQFANKDGITPTLSINVSPFSLHDLQFPDTFIALVSKSNVKPENITLEITESSLSKELTSVTDALTRLRMKQFKLSIDNFGTSYVMIHNQLMLQQFNLLVDDFGSGFALTKQLQHVPATELKIDRSLVQNMLKQESCSIITKKIIEVGHGLGMKIVAVGVETAEQLEFLRANNCDLVQGYLFSRPLSTLELQDWIKSYNKIGQ